jgi:putative heme-binding domain-containing protein
MLSSLAALLLILFPGRTLAQTQKTNFFLPQNPVAAAYILGRLSNQELIVAPRSEFVYVALLKRGGLDRKYRLEALDGLATLRHTDRLSELLAGLSALDKNGEDSAGTMRDFLPILLQSSPAELAAKRADLEKLAVESQLALTRQIAYAALVTADHSIEPAWKQAKAEHLADLILAIPLIRDPGLRAGFYSKIEPLVRKGEATDVRRAAITAIVAVPGHDAETFRMLAALVEAGTERAAAIASLQRIPRKDWPKEFVAPLLNSLMDYLQNVPPSQWTDADFLSALQFATDLASLLPEAQGPAMAKTLRGLGPAIVVLRTVYEQMRYDKQLIVVEAGKPVAITLENADAMPHNVAILMPGALEEVGNAAEKMPAEPDAEGRLYVPASPKVLHATKLVAPGEKTQLAFSAPDEPGDYPYVCTFPGHWRVMFGTLAVVKDVDAYLASQARVEQPKITEWKLEDLAPELSKVGFGRNLEKGKELLTKLACIQCHKLGQAGYAYGPDLTDVLARYKNDRTNVLQQILEPSKIIADRYRNIAFDLTNGEPVTGMILKEDADTVIIQSGPADSLIQTLKKSDIQERRPQPSSPMPVGLLNSLSKEQIFDLLAYLESGGKPRVHDHAH